MDQTSLSSGHNTTTSASPSDTTPDAAKAAAAKGNLANVQVLTDIKTRTLALTMSLQDAERPVSKSKSVLYAKVEPEARQEPSHDMDIARNRDVDFVHNEMPSTRQGTRGSKTITRTDDLKSHVMEAGCCWSRTMQEHQENVCLHCTGVQRCA